MHATHLLQHSTAKCRWRTRHKVPYWHHMRKEKPLIGSHGVDARCVPVKKSEKPLTSDSRVLTSTTASLYSGSAPAPREVV